MINEDQDVKYMSGVIASRLCRVVLAIIVFSVCVLSLCIPFVIRFNIGHTLGATGFPFSASFVLGFVASISGLLGVVLSTIRRDFRYSARGCLLAAALFLAAASEMWAYKFGGTFDELPVLYLLPAIFLAPVCLLSFRLLVIPFTRRIVQLVKPIPFWLFFVAALAIPAVLFVWGHIYVENATGSICNWGEYHGVRQEWMPEKHSLTNITALIVGLAFAILGSTALCTNLWHEHDKGDTFYSDTASNRAQRISIDDSLTRMVICLFLLGLCFHELLTNNYLKSSITIGILFIVVSVYVFVPLRTSSVLMFVVVIGIFIALELFALTRHEVRQIGYLASHKKTNQVLVSAPKKWRLYVMNSLVCKRESSVKHTLTSASDFFYESVVESLLENLSDPDVQIRRAAVTAILAHVHSGRMAFFWLHDTLDWEAWEKNWPFLLATEPRLIKACNDSDSVTQTIASCTIVSAVARSIPLLPNASDLWEGEIPDRSISKWRYNLNSLRGSEHKEDILRIVKNPINARPEVWKVEWFDGSDLTSRRKTAYALAVLGEADKGVDMLIPMLNIDDKVAGYRDGVQRVVETLGAMGPEAQSAVPHLIDALGQADDILRSRIIWSLKRITGQDLGNNQKNWRRWWQEMGSKKQDL